LAMVQSYQVTKLGSLTDEQGAVVEPAAVSLNAVLRGGVASGDTVLIVGCGPIGSLAILASLAAGAARIYVVEANPKRAAGALELGAALNLEGASTQHVKQIRYLNHGLAVSLH